MMYYENNTLYQRRRLYTGSVPEEFSRNYSTGFETGSLKEYAAKTHAYSAFYVSEVYNILKDDIRNMDIEVYFDAATYQMKFIIVADIAEDAYARYLFMKGE
jgi:hypothetical protein